MLVVLEAAELLVDRFATDWRLAPRGRQTRFTASQPVRRRSRLWPALKRDVARAFAALRRAREREKIVEALSAKDDRLLADIGITRAQIREVAAAAVKHGPLHPSRLVSPAGRLRHDAVAVEAVANDNRPRLAA